MPQESIKKQVKDAEYWFSIELDVHKSINDKVKIAICREITKRAQSASPEPVFTALLSLALAGKVSSPLSFTVEDIQNALWLVRDLRLGFDHAAPITKLLN
jgi:hypothetical protein